MKVNTNPRNGKRRAQIRPPLASVLQAAYSTVPSTNGDHSPVHWTQCNLIDFLCLFPCQRIQGGSSAYVLGEDPSLANHILQPNDPPQYGLLLSRTQIAYKATQLTSNSGVLSLPCIYIPIDLGSSLIDEMSTRFTQSEIIHRVIETLLRTQSASGSSSSSGAGNWNAGSRSPFNILTYGYQRLNGRSEGTGIVGVNGVENYFVNTLINAIKTKEWQLLLSRIGDAAMTFLLLNTSIFIHLPNGNYFQVAGVPINDIPTFKDARLPKLLPFSFSTDPSAKETTAVSVNEQEKTKGVAQHKPLESKITPRKAEVTPPVAYAAIVFQRSTIFYARAVHSKSGVVKAGLPDSHILHQSSPRTNLVTADAEIARTIVDFLIHVFPSEFKLPLSFQSPHKGAGKFDGVSVKLPGSLKPISNKYRSLNPRMRRVLPLLKAVQSRHRNCNYNALLEAHCPASNTMLLGDRDALAPYQLSYWQVRCFVRSVVKRVFPLALFGSAENRARILEHVDEFICLQRYESMTLHRLLDGSKISHMSWLKDEDAKRRICANESKRHAEVAAEFLFFLFHDFLIPLLRTNFYITDTVSSRNRIAYFRHSTWHSITSTLSLAMKTNLLSVPLCGQAALEAQANALGCSYIRWLPKETGARPITNLRRRLPKLPVASKTQGSGPAFHIASAAASNSRSALSINTMLSNAFQVLSFERSRNPSIFGASVLGLNDIYDKLKPFQRMLLERHDGKMPKIYFVKVDIKSCFDTINQEKLIEMLNSILQSEEYLIHRYTMTYPSGGKLRKEFVRNAKDAESFCEFSETAKLLSETHRKTVFVDQVVHSFEDRDNIYELLKSHILNNLLSIDNRLYRQTTGIPQGSVLSTLLCSFFYAWVESQELSFVAEDVETLLMRYVDDFLLMTTDESLANRFLHRLCTGFPDYGCAIHPDKSMVNFEPNAVLEGSDNSGAEQPPLAMRAQFFQGEWFPWCGLLINTASLAVQSDYSRLFTVPITTSLTREARSQGKSLLTKMCNFLKSKSHALFIDADVNGVWIALRNIYQHFVVTAAKFYVYVKGQSFRKENPAFLWGVIQEALLFAYHLIQNRSNSTMAVKHACQFNIPCQRVMWLGMHAFHAVLSRKQSNFIALVEQLHQELQSTTFSSEGAKKRLYSVIQSEAVEFRAPDATIDGNGVLIKRIKF